MIILLLFCYSSSYYSNFGIPSLAGGLLKYSDVCAAELVASFLFLVDCLLLSLLKNYFEEEVELVVNCRVKYWAFLEAAAVMLG